MAHRQRENATFGLLDLPQIQAMVFVMLALCGQATMYLVREPRRFWSSRPSGWVIASSFLDILSLAGEVADHDVQRMPRH